MTDLKELLDRASEPNSPTAPPIADDLARGRAALRRHRVGMAGAALAAAVLVVGAGGLVIARDGGTSHELSPAASAASSHAALSSAPRDSSEPRTSSTPQASPYTRSVGGKPFTVSYVPPGWKVQGWSPSAVVLVHTDGSPATTVEDFEGKIAVISTTTPLPATGTVRSVDGKRFRVTSEKSATGTRVPVVGSLAASYNHGYVVVQGPTGTSTAQLLKVAAGVTATSGGEPAIG